MSVDIACAEPAFLDLTMTGLDEIPQPGEERLATDFLRSPGGGAITAVGAARLGLSRARSCRRSATTPSGCCCARCSPTTACAGTGGSCERTPVTVIMPTNGDRAMATFDPGESVTAAELAAVEPRAVVLSIPRLPLAPAGARVYVSVGDVDARALAGGELPEHLGARARAAGQRARGADCSPGLRMPRPRRRRSRERAPVAIVTLGAERRARRGRGGHGARARAWPSRPWTRRAPATCSPPPTCGPTTGARRSSSGCAGRSCMHPSR